MPPARPQQMSDPADKSDDLIAELAKLMAAGPGGQTINTSSFSKPAMTPQPAARPAPVRIPSALTPVSENKSFGEGLVLPVGKPAAAPPVTVAPAAPQAQAPAPQAAASAPHAATPAPAAPSTAAPAREFNFDIGFAQNPPSAPSPLVMQPDSSSAAPVAALIEADMVDETPAAEPVEEPEIEAEAPTPEREHAAPAQVVTPIRPVNAAQQPARPSIAQVTTTAPP